MEVFEKKKYVCRLDIILNNQDDFVQTEINWKDQKWTQTLVEIEIKASLNLQLKLMGHLVHEITP